MDYNSEQTSLPISQNAAPANKRFSLGKALAVAAGALLFCIVGAILGVMWGPSVIRDVSPTLAQSLGLAQTSHDTETKVANDGYDGELVRRVAAVSSDALHNAPIPATLDQSTASTLAGRLQAAGDTQAAYLDVTEYGRFTEAMGSPWGYATTEATLLSVWCGNLDAVMESLANEDTEALNKVSSYLTASQVGVIKVGALSHGTATRVAEEFEALLQGGAQAFVLDLRESCGGYLPEATALSSLFLQGGTLAEVAERSSNTRLSVQAGRAHYEQPLVVVISNNTTGAAEVVAAALQEHGRALCVGTPSAGCATAQCIRTLSFGGAVIYTTATLLTPDGVSYQDTGVAPNIRRNGFMSVMSTKDAGANEFLYAQDGSRDTMLECAVETVLNG